MGRLVGPAINPFCNVLCGVFPENSVRGRLTSTKIVLYYM